MLVTICDPKILYVHIPKTGGSSFEKWIEKSLSTPSRWQHKNIDHLYFDEIQVLTKRRFDIEKHYKFTISRNPYDRFYSMCLHLSGAVSPHSCGISAEVDPIPASKPDASSSGSACL